MISVWCGGGYWLAGWAGLVDGLRGIRLSRRAETIARTQYNNGREEMGFARIQDGLLLLHAGGCLFVCSMRVKMKWHNMRRKSRLG